MNKQTYNAYLFRTEKAGFFSGFLIVFDEMFRLIHCCRTLEKSDIKAVPQESYEAKVTKLGITFSRTVTSDVFEAGKVVGTTSKVAASGRLIAEADTVLTKQTNEPTDIIIGLTGEESVVFKDSKGECESWYSPTRFWSKKRFKAFEQDVKKDFTLHITAATSDKRLVEFDMPFLLACIPEISTFNCDVLNKIRVKQQINSILMSNAPMEQKAEILRKYFKL